MRGGAFVRGKRVKELACAVRAGDRVELALRSSRASPVGKDRIPMTVHGFRDDEARAKAIRKWEAEVAAKGGGKK